MVLRESCLIQTKGNTNETMDANYKSQQMPPLSTEFDECVMLNHCKTLFRAGVHATMHTALPIKVRQSLICYRCDSDNAKSTLNNLPQLIMLPFMASQTEGRLCHSDTITLRYRCRSLPASRSDGNKP
jgi:hypothetical protein